MKKLLPLLIGLSLGGVSIFGHAENLLQVYQQAKESNPDLRKSAADRDSAFEKINESRGSLLPQLGLGADYAINRGYRDNDSKTNSTSGSLQLTQTIFDMSKWRQLSLTEQAAGIQDVTFQSAEQTLILNTATAYFNVLRAIDTLEYTQAQKTFLYQTLDQVTQQFNVGLVAITDVQNARAQYDQVIASEVTARNNLNNALENLRQVSGMYYSELNALNIDRFKTKSQGRINELLKEAEGRNLDLLAARLNQDVAREQIRLAQTGHMPTVGLTASTSLSDTDNKNNSSTSISGNTVSGNNTVGVNLSMPLYSGGVTTSQVKQAQYNFVGSSEQLESTHRQVVNLVRTSYNNTNASISAIDALKQSVVSAQSSLDATEAGYQVGTRTIVDVLSATTTLYNAKQQLSGSRYDYLVSLLNIKSALGSLNQADLQTLNNDLGAAISTQVEISNLQPTTPRY